MDITTTDEIEKALAIVGAEDFSTNGVYGVIEVKGSFAQAIAEEICDSQEGRIRLGLEGKSLNVLRQGLLEINCPGFYTQGKAVRGIVHRAARRMGYERKQP